MKKKVNTFLKFYSSIFHTQLQHFINNRGQEINLYIHAELAAQSRPRALTDTIKVMTITPAQAERGLILPETCPRPLCLPCASL